METLAEVDEFVSSLDCAQGLTDERKQVLLSAFVRVVEPEIDLSWSYIVLSADGGGVSRKPGHITLNWRRLFDVATDVGVAGLGMTTDERYVHALVGLYIWNRILRGMEVDFTDHEASVIEALWSGAVSRLERLDLLDLTNQARMSRNLPLLTEGQFDVAVVRLTEMRCIKSGDDGMIRRREWVRRRT